MPNIVVLGAGVSGLTSALQLARSNEGHKITVAAKHMPGDYDIEYCSPWAGADFVPNLSKSQSKQTIDSLAGAGASIGNSGELANEFENKTWPELERLAREMPEAGIHFQETRIYQEAGQVSETAVWFENQLKDRKNVPGDLRWLIDNYRRLSTWEVPAGFQSGFSFISVCINTALYLPWIASQCLKHGVVIRRGIANHILDAANLHHSGKRADLILNCTGLSSLRLSGVEDSTLFPGRGQVVVVRNEPPIMHTASSSEYEPGESCYMMNRAAGGGAILGGSNHKGNWESQPDPNIAIRIMKRAVQLCPEMVPNGKGIEGLSIIRHGVGLRPMRTGGIRVEKEVIDGVHVVHNYGHGGCGYQTSYGAAEAVKKLVDESLSQRANL